MARGVNKVILIGNIGQDPELRYTQSGTAVCNLRIATPESYKDRDGQWVEKTEWHSVVAWARLAEICGEYLRKGSRVYFEGSLQTRKWEDRDGNSRQSTEVRAREMMMLDSRNSGGGSESSGYRSSQRSSQYEQDRPSDTRPQRQERPVDASEPAAPSPSQDNPFEGDDGLPF